MKIRLVIVLLLLSYSSSLAQQYNDEEIAIFYKKIIKTLAHDSLRGREASTEYEQKAGVFINKVFKEIFSKKSESFSFEYKEGQNEGYKKSENIFYFHDIKADSTVILSAHYDHLGVGSDRTRSYGKTGIHNGADDNASGVALMLSLAKTIKSSEIEKYNFLFVAYSAHENGLFGSKAFFSFLVQKKVPIALVLNFDMVGRFDEKARVLNIYGIKTLNKNQTFLQKPVFEGNIYTENSEKVLLTDAGVFAENNIPALSFTTGIHNDYHKLSDDEEFINYDGILMVQKLVEQFFNNQK
ncbi:MAG TPA: M28 family peptidase [Leadbetterella sp.]|nr:M28 family peptidase [Leadbetterella sp.]